MPQQYVPVPNLLLDKSAGMNDAQWKEYEVIILFLIGQECA